MRTRFNAAIAGLGAVATAAGLVLLGAGAAHAAAPSWEPDPQAVGTITLYDSSGNPVSSGDINSQTAVYAVGSATVRAGDVKAAVFGASPNPTATSTASSSWSKEQLTGFTAYPVATGPANIQTLSQTHPVAMISSTDTTIGTLASDFPNDTAHDSNAAYANLYQLRLETANTGGSFQTGVYDELTVSVSGTTWTQVYPARATATALISSANPVAAGTNVTLTATETPATAGSVQFKDGASNIGSAVAVNGSGVATLSTSFSTQGAHSLTAVFTPTDTTNWVGSTSAALTENVTAPATSTSTSLAVTQDGYVGDDVKLVATVTPSAAVGTVSFTDNGTAISGTPTQNPQGTYTLDLPSGLAAGGHSIVANFTATDPTAYTNSASPAQSFVLQAHATGACAQTGSQCTDQQNIQVNVPVGTLVISTPYTAANPWGGGTNPVATMGLTTNATMLTVSQAFNNIQITDARSGNLPYTATALASTLNGPGTQAISGENVGLTGLVAVGSSGYSGPTTGTVNNAAASPPVQPGDTGSQGLGGTLGHTIFSTTNGLGVLTMNGTLTINAPVNTLPGQYNGTITFTVG